MLKKLKYLGPLLILILLLSSCAKPLDTKQQVKSDLTALQQIVAAQQAALSTLESAGQNDPSAYLKIQKKYPDQNLLDVPTTKVAEDAKARETAYQTLKTQQTKLKPITRRLTKVAKQADSDLPIEAIKDLNQSVKISTLDYTTLSNFYDAAVTAETDFYSQHQTADVAESDLDAPINRLNQYYSSVYQQAEIAKVNINTVSAQLKKVQNQL